jgi:hypothetical protein
MNKETSPSMRYYHIRKSAANNSWYIAENGYIFLENFASIEDAKETLKALYAKTGADLANMSVEVHFS